MGEGWGYAGYGRNDDGPSPSPVAACPNRLGCRRVGEASKPVAFHLATLFQRAKVAAEVGSPPPPGVVYDGKTLAGLVVPVALARKLVEAHDYA